MKIGSFFKRYKNNNKKKNFLRRILEKKSTNVFFSSMRHKVTSCSSTMVTKQKQSSYIQSALNMGGLAKSDKIRHISTVSAIFNYQIRQIIPQLRRCPPENGECIHTNMIRSREMLTLYFVATCIFRVIRNARWKIFSLSLNITFSYLLHLLDYDDMQCNIVKLYKFRNALIFY